MPLTVHTAPRISAIEAVDLARRLYGIEVSVEELPSERDQNFLLRDSAGARFVLKLANREEDREVLDFQNQAWAHLAAKGLSVPRLILTENGRGIAEANGNLLRLFTWIDGEILASVRPHDEKLLASLGELLAAVDHALEDFRHPAAHRRLHWDIRHADLARAHLPLLP